jgi:hypothetical protein
VAAEEMEILLKVVRFDVDRITRMTLVQVCTEVQEIDLRKGGGAPSKM